MHLKIKACITNALLFVVAVVQAQVKPSTTVDYEPYRNIPGLNSKVAGIKQKASIIELTRGNGSPYDTLSVETYDTVGRSASYTSFKAYTKKREKTTIMTYLEKDNIHETLYREINCPLPNKRVLDSIFDKKGRDSIVRTVSTTPGDPNVYVYEYFFTYNNLGQLVNHKYVIGTRLINYSNYYYEAGRLIKEEFYFNPTVVKNAWYEITYTYSGDSVLTKKEKCEVRNGVRTPIGYNEYSYDNKRLVNEKYWDLTAEVGKTPTTVKYDYNNNGSLAKMLIQKDTLYRTVEYLYKQNKITSVHVETNAKSGFYREYYVTANIGNEKKLPIIFDAEYIYDQRGSLIERRSRLNGEWENISDYVFQYY